jgi:hypothetical protein
MTTSTDSYLFAYFRGEYSEDGEQVYFAVSDPSRPLHFTELAGSRPVLVSEVGERGVRDPFLIRNRLTGAFHLLGTDERIFPGKNWDDVVRYGSRNVLIWDSPDLVTWSEPRLVELAPASAGCTWAPEAVFDPLRGEYVVVWASTLYDDEDSRRGDGSHLRILASRTRDFVAFSEPAVYIDRGHSVIDTTFIENGGVLHRFSKDERQASPSAPTGKHVFHERGTGVFGDFELVREGIAASLLAHGEGPVVVPAPEGKAWFLLIDEFSGRGYVAFESDDLDAGEWRPADARLPAGARHGSLLPITAEERERLLAACAPVTAS